MTTFQNMYLEAKTVQERFNKGCRSKLNRFLGGHEVSVNLGGFQRRKR